MSGPRVLIARLDNAGDVLLSGPAVRAVAGAGATVHFLSGPHGADAAGLLPGVAERSVFHAPWVDFEPGPVDPAAIASVTARLRALALDEAIVFTSFHQSPLPLALVLKMAGIAKVCAISEDYPGSLLDVRHRVDDAVHEVERNLSLARAAGYPAGDDDPRLRVELDPAARARADILTGAWRTDASPYVVVHPGASVPARAWSLARMAALVELLARSGVNVVVTGGPAERERCAAVCGDSGAVDLSGATDLGVLAALLEGARVVVTGNTGPAHLAAAVGTPVVSLFAPTVPLGRWAPWRVPHVVLGDQEIVCAGCRARRCPVPGHPCLDTVTPAAVRDAVERLWDARDAEGSARTAARVPA